MRILSKPDEYLSMKNLIDFRFILNFDKTTKIQETNFLKETYKYFSYHNFLKYYIENNMYLKFSFHESIGNAGTRRITLVIDTFTPKLNEPPESVSITEFLSVGYNGIKEFVDMKNNINKYNL